MKQSVIFFKPWSANDADLAEKAFKLALSFIGSLGVSYVSNEDRKLIEITIDTPELVLFMEKFDKLQTPFIFDFDDDQNDSIVIRCDRFIPEALGKFDINDYLQALALPLYVKSLDQNFPAIEISDHLAVVNPLCDRVDLLEAMMTIESPTFYIQKGHAQNQYDLIFRRKPRYHGGQEQFERSIKVLDDGSICFQGLIFKSINHLLGNNNIVLVRHPNLPFYEKIELGTPLSSHLTKDQLAEMQVDMEIEENNGFKLN